MLPEPEHLERFFNLIDAPGYIRPWIDRFYEPAEIRLILLLDSAKLIEEKIADRLKRDDQGPADAPLFINRAFKRGVMNRLPDGRFEMADLHTRFDIWAMFEGWMDIPEDIRNRLNDWELAHYAEVHKDQLAALRHSRRPDPTRACPEYLLLHEAEALLDRVDRIYLWPCNCRSMMARCSRTVYTCLRFSNDRGLGWEISHSRARRIVHDANRRGLMQSGEIVMQPDGTITGAICNCCADCCFPHLLAKNEGVEKLWPKSRYAARHRPERCTACGLCVKRCPFEAFDIRSHLKNGKKGRPKKQIFFDRRQCRGCGVCSTACPESAIEMLPADV